MSYPFSKKKSGLFDGVAIANLFIRLSKIADNDRCHFLIFDHPEAQMQYKYSFETIWDILGFLWELSGLFNIFSGFFRDFKNHCMNTHRCVNCWVCRRVSFRTSSSVRTCWERPNHVTDSSAYCWRLSPQMKKSQTTVPGIDSWPDIRHWLRVWLPERCGCCCSCY